MQHHLYSRRLGILQPYELWQNEATTNTYSFSPGHSSGRTYLWAEESAKWQKYRKIGGTASTPDNPSVYLQCDNANPLSWADLKGVPTTETFDGAVVPCDSTAVGDTVFDFKWTDSMISAATIGINSEQCEIYVPNNASRGSSLTLNNSVHAGDFTLTSLLGCGGFPGAVAFRTTFARLDIFIGGTRYGVGSIQSYASPAGQGDWVFDGITQFPGTSLATSRTVTVSRVGNNLTLTAGAVTKNVTVSGTLGVIKLNNYALDIADTIWMDDFSLVDGSSNPLYIDITGLST